MKFSVTFSAPFFALASALLAKADFPGSTFGLTYNTTSSEVASQGYLALVPSGDPAAYTLALTDTESVVSAYFTISGPTAYLHTACPVSGLSAVLVPPSEPIGDLKYLFQWWNSTTGENPPSNSDATDFVLGPSPTFDTLVLQSSVGSGIWKAASYQGQMVVGWSENTTGGIPITLVKTTPSSC